MKRGGCVLVAALLMMCLATVAVAEDVWVVEEAGISFTLPKSILMQDISSELEEENDHLLILADMFNMEISYALSCFYYDYLEGKWLDTMEDVDVWAHATYLGDLDNGFTYEKTEYNGTAYLLVYDEAGTERHISTVNNGWACTLSAFAEEGVPLDDAAIATMTRMIEAIVVEKR